MIWREGYGALHINMAYVVVLMGLFFSFIIGYNFWPIDGIKKNNEKSRTRQVREGEWQ